MIVLKACKQRNLVMLGLSTKKPDDCQAPSLEFSTTTFGLGHNMLVQLGLVHIDQNSGILKSTWVTGT